MGTRALFSTKIVPSYYGTFGEAPPASTYLRVATVQNRINNNTGTLSVSRDRWAVYISHIIGSYDRTDLKLVHNGWYSTNSGETNVGNSYTIEEAAILANGTYAQVLWSGSGTKTIASADNDIVSDAVTAASVGLSTFAKGTTIWTKIIYSCTTGNKIPVTARDVRTVAAAQSLQYQASATTMSTALATGVFTYTGTAPATNILPPVPVIIGTMASDAATYIGIGDSLMEGIGAASNSTSVGAAGHGWFQGVMHTAVAPDDDAIASLNMARSGNDTPDYTGVNTKWAEYIKYAKYPVVALGASDIGSGCTGNLSTMNSRESSMLSIISGKTSVKPIRYNLTPRVNSTDSWATLVNQTVLGACWDEGGTADQFNDAVNAAVGTTYLGSLIQSSILASPSSWFVNYLVANGGTATSAVMFDNTHYSTYGHELISTDFRTYFRSL